MAISYRSKITPNKMKIIAIALFLFLSSNLYINNSFALEIEQSDLTAEVEVNKSGYIDIEEEVSLKKLDPKIEFVIRKISLNSDKDSQLEVDEINVKTKSGSILKFEKKIESDILSIIVPLEQDIDGDYIIYSYRLGGAIKYFSDKDGYDYLVKNDFFNLNLTSAEVTIFLPKEIEEKNIKFSCFDSNKLTNVCRA